MSKTEPRARPPRAPAKKTTPRARTGKPARKPPAKSTAPKPSSGIVLFSRTEQRLADVEQWLASGMTPRQVARRCLQEFGLKSRSQGNAYVATVLKRWAIDAEQEPRESRRNRLRATLEGAIHTALERRKIVRLTRDKWREVPDPDVKAVARLTQTLGMLDGLIDRTAMAEARAREMAAREVQAFVAALRSGLDEDTWKRVDRALDEARDGRGTPAPAPDPD